MKLTIDKRWKFATCDTEGTSIYEDKLTDRIPSTVTVPQGVRLGR